MPKYRKKPVMIEAEQLTWANWESVCSLVGVGKLIEGKPEGTYIDGEGNATDDSTDIIGLLIPTLEGLMVARQGDWIIKGIQGECYPCKPDIFEATYELVEEYE